MKPVTTSLGEEEIREIKQRGIAVNDLVRLGLQYLDVLNRENKELKRLNDKYEYLERRLNHINKILLSHVAEANKNEVNNERTNQGKL